MQESITTKSLLSARKSTGYWPDEMKQQFANAPYLPKDQLFQKEGVILRPRVVLKANSHSGSQDLLVQEMMSTRTEHGPARPRRDAAN